MSASVHAYSMLKFLPYLSLVMLISFMLIKKTQCNTLPTSHQPLSGDNFKPRYVQKCVLGPKGPNMVIPTQTPRKLQILIFFTLAKSALLIRFQRALNDYHCIYSPIDIANFLKFTQICPNLVHYDVI